MSSKNSSELCNLYAAADSVFVYKQMTIRVECCVQLRENQEEASPGRPKRRSFQNNKETEYEYVKWIEMGGEGQMAG
jgi:hypothetical protein